MYASRNIKTPKTQGLMLSANAAATIIPIVKFSTMDYSAVSQQNAELHHFNPFRLQDTKVH